MFSFHLFGLSSMRPSPSVKFNKCAHAIASLISRPEDSVLCIVLYVLFYIYIILRGGRGVEGYIV